MIGAGGRDGTGGILGTLYGDGGGGASAGSALVRGYSILHNAGVLEDGLQQRFVEVRRRVSSLPIIFSVATLICTAVHWEIQNKTH